MSGARDSRGRGAGDADADVIAAGVPPERVALVHHDQRLTYAELQRQVARAAAALRAHGLQRGDRALLQLPKGVPFIALHLACLRHGFLSVPCNPGATASEIAHVLADSGARAHVHAGNVAAFLQQDADATGPPPPPPAGDAGAVLMYTSGTTGAPKGVLLTHGNLRANTRALAAAWEWSGSDVLLHALPLFHVHGLLVALHGALAASATTILLDAFEAAAVLAALREHRCTLFMGVPTMYHRLAQLPRPAGAAPGADAGPARVAGEELPHLRLCVCGSAPLRPDTAAAFRARFGHAILERYGMTEALMITSQPLRGERQAGRVGAPLTGVQLRVVRHGETDAGALRTPLPPGEVGEVLVRGPSVFSGYWGRPDLTAVVLDAEGWLATGDLGHLDEHGVLTLVGRARELIICGGFNVYPKEIERVLEEHPGVSEAAVFGLPDADLGEIVAAAVVCAPESAARRNARVDPRDALTAAGGDACGVAFVAELLAHCRTRLAAYKCPRTLALLDELPRNGMGKVQKASLAARPEFQRARPAHEAGTSALPAAGERSGDPRDAQRAGDRRA